MVERGPSSRSASGPAPMASCRRCASSTSWRVCRADRPPADRRGETGARPAASRPCGEVRTVGPMLEEQRSVHAAVRTTEHDVRDDIIVHPVVHNLKFPAGGARQRERNTMMSRISQDPLADFRALRDYVPGDDPRSVHWASTARTGRLVVKDHSGCANRCASSCSRRSTVRSLRPCSRKRSRSRPASSSTPSPRISVTARTRDAAHAGRLESITGRATGARTVRQGAAHRVAVDAGRRPCAPARSGHRSGLLDCRGFLAAHRRQLATNAGSVIGSWSSESVSDRPSCASSHAPRSMFATPRSSSAGGAWDWSREDRPPLVVLARGIECAAVGVTAYQIERVFEPGIQPMDDRSDPGALTRGQAAHDRPMVAPDRRSTAAVIAAMTYAIRDAGGDVPGDLARSIVRG